MGQLSELLKKRREELEKTPLDVSMETRIRVQFIEDIDNGDFKALPSYLHAYGFVKKYAEYLGFSNSEIKELFESEYPKESSANKDEQCKDDSINENKKHYNLFVFFIILAAICLVIGLGYYIMSDDGETVAEYNIESVEPTASVNELDSETVVKEKAVVDGPLVDTEVASTNNLSNENHAGQPDSLEILNSNNMQNPVVVGSIIDTGELENTVITSTISQSDVNKHVKSITLAFSGKCWVRFIPDTGDIKDFIANENTVERLYFTDRFNIKIGDASTVSISYGNQIFSDFGEEGQPRDLNYVVKDGFLEPEPSR